MTGISGTDSNKPSFPPVVEPYRSMINEVWVNDLWKTYLWTSDAGQRITMKKSQSTWEGAEERRQSN